MTLTDQLSYLKRLRNRLRYPVTKDDTDAIRAITNNIEKLKLLAESSEDMRTEEQPHHD